MRAAKAPKEVQRTLRGRPRRAARVMIVEDHYLVRLGLRALLEMQSDIEVCAEADTVVGALKQLEKVSPDIVIVDLSLREGSGIDLIRDLQVHFPGTHVLTLSMHDERLYAERALRAGARGYIMKSDPPERVLDGVRAVLRGELFVSSEVANALLHTFVSGTKRKTDRTGVDLLTNRELQVFECIGMAQTTGDIATHLHLSVKTIETYRANIKRKLGLKNGTDLTHAAIHWLESQSPPRP